MTDFPSSYTILSLHLRPCSSVVERVLGKDEITGSIPVMGCSVSVARQERRERMRNVMKW